MTVESLDPLVPAGQQVKQQPHGRTGFIGAAVLAVDIVGEDQPLGFFGLEMSVEEIGEAAGEKHQQLGCLIAAEAAKPSEETQSFTQSGEPPGGKIGRRFEEEGLKIAGERLELAIDREKGIAVAPRIAADLVCRPFRIGPPAQDPPILQRQGQDRIAGDHPQAMRAEIEVADDRRHQHAGDVGRKGHAMARDHLLGDAGAAKDFASLEHEHRTASAREIGGGGQPVMAAADNDCVVAALLDTLCGHDAPDFALANSCPSRRYEASV